MESAFHYLKEGPIVLAWLALFGYSMIRGIILIGGLFLLYRLARLRTRKVSPQMTPAKIIRAEFISNVLVFVLDSTLFVAWVRFGLFHYAPAAGFSANALTFAVLLVWVEIWFYAFHRVIHHPWFYPWIHRLHHRALIPNPMSAFSFSLIERLELFLSSMLFVAVVGQFVPMTLSGILGYFAFNVVFTALGHTDLRIYPEFFARTPILKYLTDPSQHSLHHSRFRVNYGLFTNVLDRAFGTYAEPPPPDRKAG